MIVMVENEEVTGQLNRHAGGSRSEPRGEVVGNPMSPRPGTAGAADHRFTSDKLYQQYLQREGKSDIASQPSRHGSDRSGRHAADHFKDF